jgi:hypothetical protein
MCFSEDYLSFVSATLTRPDHCTMELQFYMIQPFKAMSVIRKSTSRTPPKTHGHKLTGVKSAIFSVC